MILFKKEAFGCGVILLLSVQVVDSTENSTRDINVHLIVFNIRSRDYNGLILLITWFWRYWRRLISQCLEEVIKSLILAFSTMWWLRLGFILSIRENPLSNYHAKIIVLLSTMIRIKPFLRRYFWSKICFQAIKAILVFLLWRSPYCS